jgi:hypothetical protein
MDRTRLLLVCLLAVMVMPSPAVAAGNGTTTGAATTDSPPTASTALRIDNHSRVTTWDWRNGTFYLTIEADAPHYVTISEVVNLKEGAGRIDAKRVFLNVGTNQVRVPADRENGQAAITLSSRWCIGSPSGCGYLATDDRDEDDPEASTSALGSNGALLAGAAIAFGMTGLAGWDKMRREGGDPRRAD